MMLMPYGMQRDEFRVDDHSWQDLADGKLDPIEVVGTLDDLSTADFGIAQDLGRVLTSFALICATELDEWLLDEWLGKDGNPDVAKFATAALDTALTWELG